MRDAFWWWGIPLASSVMLAVLLAADRGAADPAGRRGGQAAVPALAAGDAPVLVQDAAGRRSGPRLLPTALAASIVLQLPPACADQRCQLVLWRHEPGAEPVEQWRAEPRVRGDACLPIGGLEPGGSYDLAVRHAAFGAPGERRVTQVRAGSVLDWAEPAGSR
jgi:hypothetical protein